MNNLANSAISINTILTQLAKSSTSTVDKGRKLEVLSVEYFKASPLYSTKFSDIWLWRDWPERGTSPDVGIDIVAKLRNEDGFCAIQCKFYSQNYVVQKQDIDSFFTASGKKWFKNRIIICTSDKWSKHAEDALKDQTTPVSRVRPQDWDDIDWSKVDPCNPTNLEKRPRKTLLPHQEEAVHDVLDGFSRSDRGKLIMACGTGKTFTSLNIMEGVVGKNGIALFLVPSISLLAQTIKEWASDASFMFNCYAVCSDGTVGKSNNTKEDSKVFDLAIPACTSSTALIQSYKNQPPESLTVIFSTYHSSAVISEAQKQGLPDIDIIICDEAHRTTGVTNKELDGDSIFVNIHDQKFIRAKKRLYMTATPRIYAENTKIIVRNKEDVILCSMDDISTYGELFHHLSFSEAINSGLLSDYRVLVLAVDEEYVSKKAQGLISSSMEGLNFSDDIGKIFGCYDGLAKHCKSDSEYNCARKAVAFSSTIANSKRITNLFQDVSAFIKSKSSTNDEFVFEIDHIDGTFNSLARNKKIDWLKEDSEGGVCRILSNARCLSEGIDVPALDAVIFFNPRNSIIDIVQAVGRVMRKAQGKQYGYILLPVVVSSKSSIDETLNNTNYAVVWSVLRALRAHDDRLKSIIADLSFKKFKTDKISIIGISDANKDICDDFAVGFKEFQKAVYAKIVDKCGERLYNIEEREEFFELLRTSMTNNNIYKKPQQPKTGAYTLDLVNWNVHGVYLTNKIDPCGNYLEHMVYLKHTQCISSPEEFLNELYKYNEEIELALGVGKLDWNNKDDLKNKTISIRYKFDFRNRDNWPEGIEWLTTMMKKFNTVFRPYVHKVKKDLKIKDDLR